jgi:lactoylglutathione lyase
MKHGSTVIAFVEDPNGYKIELIQLGTQGSANKEQESAPELATQSSRRIPND